MNMLCTATCQYRCVTQKGRIIDIPEDDLDLPIVKQNFTPSQSPAPAPLKFPRVRIPETEAPDFSNGTPKPVLPQAAEPLPPPGIIAEAPQPAPAPVSSSQSEPPGGADNPDFQTMTPAQLHAWLDAAGVRHSRRLNRDELAALAAKAAAAIK